MDLPKNRLAELFNVNQYIVSQVNPLAPLLTPVPSGIPWLTELSLLLKYQLVGVAQGLSQIASGLLVRPFGFRLVDILLQDYEGTVTIQPSWGLSELTKFISNFDEARVTQYTLDGERATWPQIPLIRSLCEVEFKLDAIAAKLSYSLANLRSARGPRPSEAVDASGVEAATIRGKLPSFVDLSIYGLEAEANERPKGSASGSVSASPHVQGLTGLASSVSMLNLAAVDFEGQAVN